MATTKRQVDIASIKKPKSYTWLSVLAKRTRM